MLARLPVCRLDNGVEAVGKLVCGLGRNAILLLQVVESIVQVRPQRVRRCARAAHVEPYDGPPHPFPLQLHDPQSLEELPLAQEIGFERIDEHRLAKAARAAQIIIRVVCVGKMPDDIRLVNIKVSILPDFLKRLNAYGQSSVSCLCHSFLFLFANIRFFPQSSCFFLHSLSIIMLVLCPKRDIALRCARVDPPQLLFLPLSWWSKKRSFAVAARLPCCSSCCSSCRGSWLWPWASWRSERRTLEDVRVDGSCRNAVVDHCV